MALPPDGSTKAPPLPAPMTLEPTPPESSHPAYVSPAAGHFLPGNPLPYLAPSATHQPELLLLSWMIATLNTIVTDLQSHPLVTDPLPYPASFTDQQAYRLYIQIRNTLRHLGTITTELCQGIRILQFLPGSPGSPGHYRIDPAAFPHRPLPTSSPHQSCRLPLGLHQYRHNTALSHTLRQGAVRDPAIGHQFTVQPPLHQHPTLTDSLSLTSPAPTAIAAHFTNPFGQPLQSHQRLPRRHLLARGPRLLPTISTAHLTRLPFHFHLGHACTCVCDKKEHTQTNTKLNQRFACMTSGIPTVSFAIITLSFVSTFCPQPFSNTPHSCYPAASAFCYVHR